MTRENPRRISSRAPTSRPRRVAGQGSMKPSGATEDVEQLEPTEPTEVAAAEAPPPEPPVRLDKPVLRPIAEPSEPAPEAEPEGVPEAEPDPEGSDEKSGSLASLFDSTRATTILVVIALVLAIAAGGLFTYRAVSDTGGSGSPRATADPLVPPPNGVIPVPSGRPVLISGDDAQEAVAAAAKDAVTILGASYKTFDTQVATAASLMTPTFATKFKQTKAAIRKKFLASKIEVQVRIVAQGVVRANRSQVQALLFLNQYVTKDGKDTTYTPYRALVTVVHTDKGWLVSDLDTK